MRISRRDLLKAGMGAAALAALPRPLRAGLGELGPALPPLVQSAEVKELALRAVEAARSAGAAYADVRLTRTRSRGRRGMADSERLTVGVRALVDGYWGFASSRVWSPDEMARLGRSAVENARAATLVGPAPAVGLAPAPVARDEHWTMPVEIDPFAISPFEIQDYFFSLSAFVQRFRDFKVDFGDAHFTVQDRAFASSEGSYVTQRVYRSGAPVVVRYKDRLARTLDVVDMAGMGFEVYKGQPIREHVRRVMEELEEDAKLPVKPVEVGRYEVVFDARSVAALVAATLGQATQLDRALGYEANASGTSYLNDPLAMLGQFDFGTPLLTLTANRTERGGLATVAWDEEGVPSDEFVLIREGVLEDFQTTRESATWLAEYYARKGRPVRSHGCAAAPSALEAPMTHTPNLVLSPGPEALDFDAAVAGMKRGLAVRELAVRTDFQDLSATGAGMIVYEVKDGKRVALVAGAGFLLRTVDLWKNLVALGGPESCRRFARVSSKGEPAQATYYSVATPVAVFKDVTIIDPKRKA